jgi:hypothetical protein
VHFTGAFILELSGGDNPEDTMARARRARTYLRQTARRLALAPVTATNFSHG